MAGHSFKTIGLVGRQPLTQVAETLDEVFQFLHQSQLEVLIDPDTAAYFQQHAPQSCPLNELGTACDLIIVVGGDGSLLHIARHALTGNTPVLGINRGHLGFLADIAPDNFEIALAEILAGQYTVEERLVLETNVFYRNQCIYSEIAINDIVIKQSDLSNMLSFDIHVDNHCIAQERADGLILATPTGSTAYALSGGGPILHPGVQAYLLLSMFSHTLSNRPVVVPKESVTQVSIGEINPSHASLRCDGLNIVQLEPGSYITAKPFAKTLQLIHPQQYNYFDNLRSKLGWGRKAINKSRETVDAHTNQY